MYLFTMTIEVVFFQTPGIKRGKNPRNYDLLHVLDILYNKATVKAELTQPFFRAVCRLYPNTV